MLAQIRVLLFLLVFRGGVFATADEDKLQPATASDQGLVPIVLLNIDAVTDQPSYDERQARMSLYTESPRAKARRETILRSMLAARRRKILRQRITPEATASKVQTTPTASRRYSMRRKPVVRESPSGDLFEMQESQNGVYVTVPEQLATNDTQIVIETLAERTGISSLKRNAAASKPHQQRANNSLLEQQHQQHQQQRSKKIVAMSASLYNHFNPVESNIPIEDMSQFLYFGQKLRGTGMGKDSMPASPPPKKLLAGLEGTIDDDMNSVDRSSSIVSSKSTKMRTTSLREHTTKAVCPKNSDKSYAQVEARSINSINVTDVETNTAEADIAAASNLRIVVTEATQPTTTASITSSTTATESSTTIASTTTKESLSSAESTVSKSKEQHVTESTTAAAAAARRALRNSTGAFASSSSFTSPQPQQQQQQQIGSAGETVEQAAPRSRSQQQQQQQQPGFTIRWTDVRSKRRRLANRRREKSARNMDEPVSSATTMDPPVFPVTPQIPVESSSTTSTTTTTTEESNMMDGEEDGTTEPTTTMKMLDPSEVQKMYRAGSTSSSTTEEVPTTIANTPSSSSKSPERSPEVRGRNLEDKAKDGVLPIMQLYNTSSMFNASDSSTMTTTSTTTTTTTTTTTVLPAEVVTEPPTTTIAQHSTPASTTTSTSTTTRPRPRATRTTTTTSKPRHEYNNSGYYPLEIGNRTFYEPPAFVAIGGPFVNASEVISRRHDGDTLASQETVAVVSYILATLVVFPIAVGVGLILRRLILRNRKVLEESDTSSEISCRKDALNLETGDFKTSIEKTITKLPRIQHLCHEAEKPQPLSSQESRWEFPRDKLRLQTVLGEGNFGQVWKAEADDLTGHQGQTRLVAVKTVKEGASDREKEDLVRELAIMQRVGSHPNVVTLLGCCTEQEPHYLILEYVMYGKLLAYLRDHRTRQDFYNFSEDSAALTSRDLTVFGYCVARGMEYLASKKIIHRDMAARNVLVDHNKLCKIADFGMSRFADENGEVIETRHGQRNALPIRWMAPESLIYSLFTTKTDVWSFGILMWEIVTLGSTPYPDMTAREVMRSVQSGYRLEQPSHCRSELFRVIARCWHADPDRRPEFAHLRRDLAQLLEDNMNGHYVDLESFASECND